MRYAGETLGKVQRNQPRLIQDQPSVRDQKGASLLLGTWRLEVRWKEFCRVGFRGHLPAPCAPDRGRQDTQPAHSNSHGIFHPVDYRHYCRRHHRQAPLAVQHCNGDRLSGTLRNHHSKQRGPGEPHPEILNRRDAWLGTLLQRTMDRLHPVFIITFVASLEFFASDPRQQYRSGGPTELGHHYDWRIIVSTALTLIIIPGLYGTALPFGQIISLSP